MQVNKNGELQIQKCGYKEIINLRCVKPYHTHPNNGSHGQNVIPDDNAISRTHLETMVADKTHEES